MATVSALVSAYLAPEFLEGRLANLVEQSLVPEIVVVCQRQGQEQALVERLGIPGLQLVLTDDIPTIYKAWNLGIEAASGQYLTSANSDDRLYPGALAGLVGMLEANGRASVAYSDIDIVKEPGGVPVNRFTWNNKVTLKALLQGCFIGPMPVWRAALHQEHGFFDEDLLIAGDYEFWLRLAKAGVGFVHTRRVWGAYTERPGGAEASAGVRTIWETARVRARFRKEAPYAKIRG